VGAGAAQPLPGGVVERETDAALVVGDLRGARRFDVTAVRRHLEPPHVAVRIVELHLGEPDLLRARVRVGVRVRIRVRLRLRHCLSLSLRLRLRLRLSSSFGEPYPRLPDSGLDELALARRVPEECRHGRRSAQHDDKSRTEMRLLAGDT
jgi:hypothetical protein